MKEFLKQYRLLLLGIALSLLGLHWASSALNRGEDTGRVGRVVISVYTPIHHVVSWPFQKIGGVFHRYIWLVGIGRENEALKQQNDALQAQLGQMSEIQAENERLARLLEFKPTVKAAPIYARVIARSTTPEFRTLLVDKGTDDGMALHMIALSPAGLVGHVNAITAHAAKVLLITDAASVVDAVVQRTRASGLIRGRSQNTCSFDFLSRGEEIEQGDTVVTSGIGGIFTAGHVIGRVTSIDKEASDMFQVVEITPSAAFENLEELVFVPGAAPPPDLPSPLETPD